MTKQKTTKKTLLTSVLSLVLCMAMLIGTTFAWFTDSVTSGKNRIQAGNLDVAMSYKNTSMTGYEDVEKPTSPDFFKDINGNQILWEPGAVAYANFKVENLGSLALKYNLQTIIAECNYTAEGKSLADVLTVKVMQEEKTYTTRELAIADAKGSTDTLESFAYVNNNMNAGTKDYFTVILYWEPGANDNDFNVNPALYIDIELSLIATQAVNEEDSFGSDYDKEAAVFTVAEANAMLNENKDVALVNCDEPNGVLKVPENYTGTLSLDNVKIASVQQSPSSTTYSLRNNAETNAIEIQILGNVVVKATEEGNSAITGTALKIDGKDKGTLTAVGKGAAAFGIGGMNTKSLSVKNITIAYVEGGCAYDVGTDTKYYKDAPEGGAAIGSGYDGAVITLNNVTVNKAIGGSKAAGIGARYHTGVTVNITNSAIAYVEGGVTAAAIGGSRVSGDATESGTRINISNCTITAKGGVYGAGIGSGYDTHCQSKQPMCEINIDGSTVNATGGKYAAGIGTGYHNAALSGEIKNSTINATSGEKVYKDTYTSAMDIGFGVTDPTREGLQTDSYIVYNGNTITMNDSLDIVSDFSALDSALKEGKDIVLANDIVMQKSVNLSNANFVLDGDGHTISMDDACENTYAIFDITGGKATIKNVTFDGIKNGAIVRTVGVEFNANNVTAVNGKHTQVQGLLRLMGKSTIENCTFKNNTCNMVISLNYDGANNDPQVVKNCVFENNACNSTAVVYYVKGAGATIDSNNFVKNTVTVADGSNAATLYMGFQENTVITNNVFENNTVNAGTSKRVAGAIMIGYDAVITGNSFVGNKVTGENAKANNVAAAAYYTDIDLSGNYWGGSAPVENDDYYNEYPNNHKVIINDYLTTYNN